MPATAFECWVEVHGPTHARSSKKEHFSPLVYIEVTTVFDVENRQEIHKYASGTIYYEMPAAKIADLDTT